VKNFPFLLLFLLTNVAIEARHIVGGDFSYDCVSPGQYNFTLTMFRDCDPDANGAGFDSSGPGLQASITVYRGNEQTPFDDFNLNAPIVTNLEFDEANPCIEVPPNICVEQGIYNFSRDLPISNESYFVVYQRCCRNGTITNIVDPGSAGMTYVLEITPEAQTVCNNSPRFNTFPAEVICTNFPVNFDNGATDPDGDQLVYEFCSPLFGGSQQNVAPNPEPPPPYTPVFFQLPEFSALNPVGGNPQIAIDPITGLITGTPTADGQFVLGVCVSEYRNGVLLSTVQRDIQLNITNCEPVIQAGIQGEVTAGVATIDINLCGSRSVSIINQSTDEAFIDEYLWEVEIPGANNFIFDTRDVNFLLPDFGYYEGTMILNPSSACSDSVKFIINSSPEVEIDYTANYDTCEVGPVQYVDLSPLRPDFPIVDWAWDLDDDNLSGERYPLIEYQEPGVKEVSLTIIDTVGCEARLETIIEWSPAPEIIIIEQGDFNICPETNVFFVDGSFPVDDTYTLDWTFGDGNIGSGLATSNFYQNPGIYDVKLEITSPIGCEAEQTFAGLIDVDSFPVSDFYWEIGPDFDIRNADINLFEDSRRAIGWDWLVPVGDPLEGPTAMYTFRDTGIQTIGLVVEHLYGCYDTLYKQIDVPPYNTFFLPNALSPNGDGKNEFWKPAGLFLDQLEEYEVFIYNRWGEQLFSSTDPDIGWNGRGRDNKLVNQGGYVYSLRYKAPRKPAELLEGTIMVVY